MKFIGICQRCAKDRSLQRLITESGSYLDQCEICDGFNQLALPASDLRLKKMIRALIRWNYFEWEHAHGSLNHLVDLFDQANFILSSHVTNIEELEFVLGELVAFSDQTGTCCAEIPIARVDDFGRGENPFLAMRIADPPLISQVAAGLKSKNHYCFENDIIGTISKYVHMIEEQIPSGTEFFRARSEYKTKRLVQLENGLIEAHYEGSSGKDMGPPPPPNASAGRLNRAGVSFLYVATDEYTAVCEVRPHPGHIVSVGRAESLAGIRVVRLTKMDFYDFYLSEELLNFYWLIHTLDKLFSMPVVPDERPIKYCLSQVFSDAFRELGFDGMRYRSSVGTGENLVLFNWEGVVDFSFSECVYVECVSYKYRKLPLVNFCEFNYINTEPNLYGKDESEIDCGRQ